MSDSGGSDSGGSDSGELSPYRALVRDQLEPLAASRAAALRAAETSCDEWRALREQLAALSAAAASATSATAAATAPGGAAREDAPHAPLHLHVDAGAGFMLPVLASAADLARLAVDAGGGGVFLQLGLPGAAAEAERRLAQSETARRAARDALSAVAADLAVARAAIEALAAPPPR